MEEPITTYANSIQQKKYICIEYNHNYSLELLIAQETSLGLKYV